MRQPRTFLLLAVVVAVLFLGVVYAAIQNVTLTVSGNVLVTPDQSNFKVAFTGQTSYDVLEGKGTATLSASGTTATMNVSGLSTAGDQVVGYFYLKNSSKDLYARTSNTVTHTNTEYFSVSVWPVEGETGFDLLKPGETGYFYITVTLKKTPITSNIKTSLTVNLVAQPAYS